jgi:hypothetical protein
LETGKPDIFLRDKAKLKWHFLLLGVTHSAGRWIAVR